MKNDQIKNVVEMNAVIEHKSVPPVQAQFVYEMIENGSVDNGIRRSLTTRVRMTRWHLFSSRPGSFHSPIAATRLAKNDRNCIVAIDRSSAKFSHNFGEEAVWFSVEFIFGRSCSCFTASRINRN